MEVALGLDGCGGGWFGVCIDASGRVRDAGVFATALDALAACRPTALAVDIPIGLTPTGDREADAAARRVLAGSATSVFNAPPRAVVDGFHDGSVRSYPQASALSRRVGGKGLSRQSWALVPKIAEIDALPAGWAPLEVHPELSFRLLDGRRLPRKRSWNGLAARRAVLADVGVVLPDDVPGGGVAAADDVLDAAVVAWTAAAALVDVPLSPHPAAPAQRDRGRPIAIWTRPA